MLNEKTRKKILNTKNREELNKIVNENNLMEVAKDKELRAHIHKVAPAMKEEPEPINIREFY